MQLQKWVQFENLKKNAIILKQIRFSGFPGFVSGCMSYLSVVSILATGDFGPVCSSKKKLHRILRLMLGCKVHFFQTGEIASHNFVNYGK